MKWIFLLLLVPSLVVAQMPPPVSVKTQSLILLKRCTNCPPKPVYGHWQSTNTTLTPAAQIQALTETATNCTVDYEWLSPEQWSSNLWYFISLQRSTDLSRGQWNDIASDTTNDMAWREVVDSNNWPAAHYRLASTLSLNITNFGAVGDLMTFTGMMIVNSNVVSTSLQWTTNDIGKVFQGFNAGPFVTYSNWGVVVTQQDIVCFVTNVSGTNLYLSLPSGKSGSFCCKIGSNNSHAIQNAIDEQSNIVAAGYGWVNIIIPDGKYLCASPQILDPTYGMNSISDTHAALTIRCGGVNFVGQGNATLETVGAGMEHFVYTNGKLVPLTWISPGYSPVVPMLDSLFWIAGPVTRHERPIQFQGVTFDGGVLQGAQSYNYWTPRQGDGAGWNTTHHAVGIWDNLLSYQTPLLITWTNCTFIHWRGEMLIDWVGAVTNAMREIYNCRFLDGNATADNMYQGQHVSGCTFNHVAKVTEFYQANATMPTVFENNFITNIAGNILVITGATTNGAMPSYTIQGNQIYGQPNFDDILMTPACNVYVISNSFFGQAEGISFSAAGLQPTDGSAAVMSNIVIAANSFNDTYLPVFTDQYPVQNVSVVDNTSAGIYLFAISGGGWKTNWLMAGNSARGGLNDTAVSAGRYFRELSDDHLGPFIYNDWSGGTNWITYGNGQLHQIIHAMTNSVFTLLPDPRVPRGAILTLTNSFSGSISLNGQLKPGNFQTMFQWDGTNWEAL